MSNEYDAVLVLSHDLNPDKSLTQQSRERVDASIKYLQCDSTKYLIMSGGHGDLGRKYGISIARAMKNYALLEGIQENRILEEDLSLETVGQLIFSKQGIIGPREFRKLIVITHNYHLPRVEAISNIVFGNSYELDFHGIRINSANETLEKEKKSLEAFRKTFEGVERGNEKQVLEILLTKHSRYNTESDYFRKKLRVLSAC